MYVLFGRNNKNLMVIRDFIVQAEPNMATIYKKYNI